MIRIQKEADEAKEKILDYTEKLSKVAADKDSSDQKLFAELDDLTRTKQFLEERLIELIRLASKYAASRNENLCLGCSGILLSSSRLIFPN